VIEAGCFVHARRKFFELADVEAAARRKSRGERAGMIYPIALEAVQRLDALFEIERGISGKATAERLTVRQELGAPLMTDLHARLTAQLAKLSRSHDLAKAINYVLRSWDAFTRFLGDGRTCITNNAAERRCARAQGMAGIEPEVGPVAGERALGRYRRNPQSGELPCRRQHVCIRLWPTA
jgi:hypothetical protein